MLASSDPAAQGDSQNAGMKRPLSPSCSVENGTSETLLQENDSMVLQSIVTDQRVKKEKKRKSLTLCEVCNIQLNSSTQAQIHNNGKSHQKRLRQLNKGKTVANPDQKEGIVACQKNERIVYYLKASTGQSSPFLSSLPAFGRTLTPQLDIKHFLPLRINGGSPLSLFPNFNTMDPVQKAVINHTFGIPPPLKKKQYISCHVCHLRFNSANQAEAHFKGHKHARKLKATEGSKHKQKNSTASRNNSAAKSLPMLNGAVSTNLNNTTQQDSPEDLKEMEAENSTVMLTPDSSISSTELVGNVTSLVSPPASELSEGTPDGNMIPAIIVSTECIENGLDISITSTSQSQKEGKKSKSHLHCPVCKVTVNSASQLEAHNSGAKHRLTLEGQNNHIKRRHGRVLSKTGRKTKRIGNKGSRSIQNKAFQCEICEIYVNSETQLKQHMNSRRHKDRLAGKPPKPKYSPYNKLHQRAALTSKLILQKQLTKTLATGFLPNPLTTAALCAIPGPFTLRTATTTLFQTPIFGPTLFRATTGPFRASHTPVIFAPY